MPKFRSCTMQGCFSLFILNLAFVMSFKTTVDFETNDCGKEFNVNNYDEFNIVAKPVFSPIGGRDHCYVTFTSQDTFRIYVQDFHVNDCTVKLLFYDNDPSQKIEKYRLGCPPHDPPLNRILTTSTGNLIIRLEKASGTTSSYQFTLTLTTGSNTGSTSVGASGSGGGISTGALIGIIVGVIVFFIIIAAFVFYFVCKQVREKKEEEIRRYEAANPSVFTTASSQHYETRDETDRNGTWSRKDREREREREKRREREEDVPKLPEPRVNGILKNSPKRRRKSRNEGGGSGYDNAGYTPSVSSTEDGSDFDFDTYKKAIEQGVPSGNAKHFSMNPDPPKDRSDRRQRRRQTADHRGGSQTSESSNDEYGYENPAFTDDKGNRRRTSSLGRVSGKASSRYAESEASSKDFDDSVSRSGRAGSYRSRTRSYSPSRTDGSRDSSDTGTSITTGSGSRFTRNPSVANSRSSVNRKHSRSSGRSVPRKSRPHDPSQGGHDHRHRSRSHDRKKESPYLPVFEDAKRIKRMHKK